jgi:hypothetical protein
MRIGGMVWFAAGFAFCLVYLNDGLGGLIGFITSAVGGVVTFILTLGGLAGGGIPGVVAVLALIGATLLVGRAWSERARGFYDADEQFNRRKRHRS